MNYCATGLTFHLPLHILAFLKQFGNKHVFLQHFLAVYTLCMFFLHN